MTFHTSQSGYSLVEVLIAIAVLLLSITGPLTIAAKSLQTSFNARDQVTATYLAQEGVEVISTLRQNSVIAAAKNGDLSQAWDWVTDSNIVECFQAAGCNFDTREEVRLDSDFRNSITSCSTINDCRMHFEESAPRAKYNLNNTQPETKFTRVITLDSITADALEVTATVTWDAGAFSGFNREVVISTIVYDVYGDL